MKPAMVFSAKVKSGPGLSGFSDGDYGGKFRSGFAQMWLVPSDEAASGPRVREITKKASASLTNQRLIL